MIKKKIKDKLLFILSFFLSYVIPKRKKSFLLGSTNGERYNDNPKYLYLYLLKNKEDAKWITENKKIYNYLKKNKYPVVMKYSLEGFFEILRNKYLIIDHSPQDILYVPHLIGNFNIIQLWHGLPIKKIALDSILTDHGFIKNIFLKHRFLNNIATKLKIYSSTKFKLICACSKEDKIHFESAFKNSNIKITGYPRNDILFEKKIHNNFINKLKNKFNKIYLYAPTFREHGKFIPFSKEGLSKLNKILKRKNIILIVKKHPFDNKLKIEQLSNIKDYSSKIDDIQELLASVDLLITDYSSIAFDFLLTKKPIIFYDYDYNKYIRNCREIYYQYKKVLPGPFIENEEKLIEYLKNINWFNDPKIKKRYEKSLNRFHKYKDGFSCKRVYNEIIKI